MNASPERIASRAKVADLRAKMDAAKPGEDKSDAILKLARARSAHTALIGREQADSASWSPPQH